MLHIMKDNYDKNSDDILKSINKMIEEQAKEKKEKKKKNEEE